MFEELKKIELECKNCTKCDLCKTRTNVVFSSGIPNNKLMLIGEAPGQNEDREGQAFVGRSGKLLDEIFKSVGLSREKDIYICNTVKCRPPENRDPTPEEKELCYSYLQQQIDILKPRIILLCGSIAMRSMLKDNIQGITKVRGKWFNGPYNSKMMPIFHPSYLLRNASREKGGPKWLMWQDIQEIKKEYDKII